MGVVGGWNYLALTVNAQRKVRLLKPMFLGGLI